MKSRLATMFCAGALLLVPMGSSNANMPMTVTVTHSCTIVVTSGGTLDPRSDFRRLTSRSGPGVPGWADVTATGNTFVVSADPPTSFDTKPAADTTPETFRAWHRSRGATSYNNTQSPRTINAGVNRIRVHMDARKSGTDRFEAGNYAATVVLRCE